jgi:hypothetical protein
LLVSEFVLSNLIKVIIHGGPYNTILLLSNLLPYHGKPRQSHCTFGCDCQVKLEKLLTHNTLMLIMLSIYSFAHVSVMAPIPYVRPTLHPIGMN